VSGWLDGWNWAVGSWVVSRGWWWKAASGRMWVMGASSIWAHRHVGMQAAGQREWARGTGGGGRVEGIRAVVRAL